jgi:hypothetical protein
MHDSLAVISRAMLLEHAPAVRVLYDKGEDGFLLLDAGMPEDPAETREDDLRVVCLGCLLDHHPEAGRATAVLAKQADVRLRYGVIAHRFLARPGLRDATPFDKWHPSREGSRGAERSERFRPGASDLVPRLYKIGVRTHPISALRRERDSRATTSTRTSSAPRSGNS